VDVADRGDADAVRALLAGADKAALSGSGARALSRAAFRGHTEVVRLLLDAGASPTAAADTTEHNTPLHDAATTGRIDAARLLLRAGAKVDARSDTIGTPLAYAAHYGGGRDMIQLLHEAGADVNAAARDGLTPLHCAVLTRHLAEAEALLELGANVDAVYGRNTPLTVAASRGDVAMTRLLLDRGAAANVRGPQGRTPLALAAYHGREAVVRLLLSRGADPVTPDESGRTPLELARQFKQPETQAILEEATGARRAGRAAPGQTGDGDRPASPNAATPTSTSASPRP
jgi:ankyrin